MAYLDDHPPSRSQFRYPRRAHPSGVVVVHTAENTPDYTGQDGGAEAVAKFIQGRQDPGSYHDLADSDSAINLVRYDAEAYHDATGSNPHSYGVSIATRADLWPSAPADWRKGAVYQAAACAAGYAHWLHARSGIVIPPRRISRDESELRVPGFISHAERDPQRRSDPGAHFPWTDFLAIYARLTADLQGGSPIIPDTEEHMPYDCYHSSQTNRYRFAVTCSGPVDVPDEEYYQTLVKHKVIKESVGVSDREYDIIHEYASRFPAVAWQTTLHDHVNGGVLDAGSLLSWAHFEAYTAAHPTTETA